MMELGRLTSLMALNGLIIATTLVGCGDSPGGSDGDVRAADGDDTLDANGGDVVQNDVDVPGPGECELNWVSGFTPFLGVRPMTWDVLEPSEAGVVGANYGFVGDGPEANFFIYIQTCRLESGSFRLAASGEDNSVLYTLSINVPQFPGPGTWLLAATDGLDVGFELQGVDDPTAHYPTHSSTSSRCEICVDATGRQGTFRCDALVEDESGEMGGIRYAGFRCPDSEPGFTP